MSLDFNEILLSTIVCASDDMFNAPIDPGHPEWHRTVEANVSSWIAYRLLDFLQQIEPEKAKTLLAEIEDELDDGDYPIAACQDAKLLGHDTEKWMADHQKWRAELPAKWAQRKAAREAAAN
jgi:hypothetical protein